MFGIYSLTLIADHNRDEDSGSLKILWGLNHSIFFIFSKEVSFRLCKVPSTSGAQEQKTAAMKEQSS